MKNSPPTFRGWRRLSGRDILRAGDRASPYPHGYRTPANMNGFSVFSFASFGWSLSRVNEARERAGFPSLTFYRRTRRGSRK